MTSVFRFGRFELRPATRELLVDSLPATLGARAFDVLLTLVERRDRLVAKSELFDLVWPGLVVEENNLQVQISTLRKVLGLQAMLTVPGRGYRFVLPEHSDGNAQVSAAEVAAGPTALPASASTPRLTNLPVAETLVGRDADTAGLTQLLAEHRLVTVLGAGGLGKTRLAQAVARRLVGAYAHGVWWVDLAALSAPEQIVAAIAAAAGVQLGEGEEVISLDRALAPRNTLLVLDNCEHLVGAVAPLVQAVLAEAANVRVLATSQEPLNAPGEHLYRLETLRVPPAATRLDAARGFSAVQLLEQRAQAVHQNFWLTEDTIANAIELCRQLDGIALAIEMAAARLPILGSDTLLARLGDRLRLLRSATRGAPARHQTLRTTLDWSHSLLTPAEQAVLRRLSAFAGSFTLELAQRVTTSPELDEWATLDALMALVDKSLVQMEQHEPPRYRLLETTRIYAVEHLAECGETAATMERHGQVMLALAEEAFRDYWITPDRPWLARYAANYEDLEAAFQRAAERKDSAVTAATGEALDCLDEVRGGTYRSRDRKEAVFGLIAGATAPVQAKLWRIVSRLRSGAIGAVSRLTAARECVAAERRLSDPRWLYRALCNFAVESARTGDFDAAMSILAEVERSEDPHWPPRLRIDRPGARGWISNYRGDAATYRSMCRACLALAEQAGAERRVAILSSNLGDAVLMAGELDEAIALLTRAEAELRALDQSQSRGVALCNLACALLMKGDLPAARMALVTALPLMRAHPSGGVIFNHVALVAGRTGQPAQAAQLLGFADAWYASIQDVRQPNEAHLAELVTRAIDTAMEPAEQAELRASGGQFTLPEAESQARRVLAQAELVGARGGRS